MRQFKSDRNIALLLPLLNDPASSYRTIQREDRPPVRHREYYLRKEAYLTLRQWGVDVKKPVLKVDDLRADALPLATWGVDVKKPVLKERVPAESEAF